MSNFGPFLIYVDRGTAGPPVQTIQNLRDVPLSDRTDKQQRLVEDAGSLYRFDQTGAGVDDGVNIITPTDGVGRWFMIGGAASTDHELLANLQGGAPSDHKHLTTAEYNTLAKVVTTYTNGEGASAMATGDAVYIDPTAPNEVLLGDADALATGRIIGLVQTGGAAGTPVRVQSAGLLVSAGAGFVTGAKVYLSTTGTTGNTLTTTAPSGANDVIVQLGIAKTTTDLEIAIREPIEL